MQQVYRFHVATVVNIHTKNCKAKVTIESITPIDYFQTDGYALCAIFIANVTSGAFIHFGFHMYVLCEVGLLTFRWAIVINV